MYTTPEEIAELEKEVAEMEEKMKGSYMARLYYQEPFDILSQVLFEAKMTDEDRAKRRNMYEDLYLREELAVKCKTSKKGSLK